MVVLCRDILGNSVSERIQDYAERFLEKHREHRGRVRAIAESDNADLVKIRGDMISVVISHRERIQGRKYQPGDHAMHLIAQTIMGLDISYCAIVEGLLLARPHKVVQQ